MLSLVHEMRPVDWDYGRLRNGLYDFCHQAKNILGDNITIVEIGSYCASGTLIFHDVFPDSKILCVDAWEKYLEDNAKYDLDRQYFELKEAEIIFDWRTHKIPNIVKNKSLSLDFCKTIEDQSIDLVYIDGNHSYSFVKEDIAHWMPKIKNGGIIGGHDWDWEGVRNAILDSFEIGRAHV